MALVSAASTFKEYARANDAFGGLNTRAGINTLRLRTVDIVSQAQFDALRALATERASPREPAPASDARETRFGRTTERREGKECVSTGRTLCVKINNKKNPDRKHKLISRNTRSQPL